MGCCDSLSKNRANNLLDERERLLNLHIKDLIIHSIPLSTSDTATKIRSIGKTIQPFIHPAISPTFAHLAIQLNMENNDIVIIEYGQYFTEESIIKNKSVFTKLVDNPNHENNSFNNFYYYYINKDGARFAKIDKELYKNYFQNNSVEYVVSLIIASQHYHLSIEEMKKNKLDNNIDTSVNHFTFNKNSNNFNRVECDVNNKISLRELCNYFKGEKWEANSYNIAFHNCQIFAAEIIKILKATRKNENDKIRLIEKEILPNCIISALWDNEKLSAVNTIGRIPVVGLAFDVIHLNNIEKS